MEVTNGVFDKEDKSRLSKPPIKKTAFLNGFWKNYGNLIADKTLFHCLKAINGELDAGGWSPFDIVGHLQKIHDKDKKIERSFYPFVETDIYKTIEACAYIIGQGDDRTEPECDRIIEILEKAQQEDGYLILYFQWVAPDKKLKNLHECHELYTLGHMIEAAVAYFEATGKDRFLNIAKRFVDYLESLVGPIGSEKALAGACDGHPEIELALCRLYRCTGERRYLNLAYTFIENRGKDPLYFALEWDRNGDWSFWSTKKKRPEHDIYILTHAVCRDMSTGNGHAVRAVYLYTAMADVASELEDYELLSACVRIFDNIISKKMYIHGGVGANIHGTNEDFPENDYELPNYSYAETCAAVGMMTFCNRMFEIFRDSKYMDTFEKILYNNALAAISRSGDKFFYANTLLNDKGFGIEGHWSCRKDRREHWHGLACCPPNITRFIASLPLYVYSSSEGDLYVNLYAGVASEIMIHGSRVNIRQETGFPYKNNTVIIINPTKTMHFRLLLRNPGWSTGISAKVNGKQFHGTLEKGYFSIDRTWSPGDRVEIDIPLRARREYMPMVKDCKNKVALVYGPVLYAMEETDNGKNLDEISVFADSGIQEEFHANFFDGTVLLSLNGERNGNPLDVKFIPYYLWNNRGDGEMAVWVDERK